MKQTIGSVVTYKVYGDADNTCTVTITSFLGDRFYGDRIDNGITVWGFRRHILPIINEEVAK
jgi:hypothetical protein